MTSTKIAIIGLGYVGLPLAVEFAKKFPVVGFDINKTRIDELLDGHDSTLEVDDDLLRSVLIDNHDHKRGLYITNSKIFIQDCNYYIITVPTPIDKNKRPDLTPLIKASKNVGSVLKKDDIVVYESTVYPGATEEECVPVLEKSSGFKYNQDFYCGYSPERINPGDKEHTVSKIKKVTSGSTPETADKVNWLYETIIEAGTHKASSIKVAEAAKVIENSQRDINIAFVNELAIIFNKLNIDTKEVLEAAGIKWNFLPFRPGLVGGHCIGVDPYYLTHKAQEIGHNPEIILSGRRMNDNMGIYISSQIVKLMIHKGHRVAGAKVLVLGITFKENCPDIRNSKVIDIINELKEFECEVDVYDPWANSEEVKNEYNIDLLPQLYFPPRGETKGGVEVGVKAAAPYNAIILAVAHEKFRDLDIRKLKNKNTVVYDIKGTLDKSIVDSRL